MPFLPVDTAVVVEVGPLIDDTDFKSLEEAIAYNETNMDVDLFKNSSAAVTKVDLTLTSGGASDWTHKGSGVYEIEITAAQNDTEGTLRLVGLCDGVLPFESPVYTVVPAKVYNALVGGSDKLEVDINQVGGSAVPHTSGKLHVLDDEGNAVANETKQDTIDTVVDAIKAKTDNLPADPASETNVNANETKIDTLDTVADAIKAVTDNLPNSGALTDLATALALSTVDTVVDAIKAKTDNLPSDPASETNVNANETKIDTMDTVVDGIKAVTDNLPNSGALTDLATAAALTAVDTVVDAIKVVTDNLPNSGALTGLATAAALSTVDTVVDAIKAVTDNLNNLSAADVNTEVLDVLNVDSFSEPSQGAPSATPTITQMLMYLYIEWVRNKVTQDADWKKVYADNGTDVLYKKATSDDDTTLTEGEAQTGA